MAWLEDLVLDEVTAERVVGHLEVGPDHHQPFGLVHGGVWCSVAETVASVGAIEAARSDTSVTGVVGSSNHTDFLRSMTTGRVEVVGVPLFVGRTQQLWQVDVTRPDGKLVARGQVRLAHLTRERE